jgi:hypothetical protein
MLSVAMIEQRNHSEIRLFEAINTGMQYFFCGGCIKKNYYHILGIRVSFSMDFLPLIDASET